MTSLRALGGAPTPPSLAHDLHALSALSIEVREAFWDVLSPNLLANVGERAASLSSAFCVAHGVAQSDIVAPVKACRFLFRQAAREGLSPEDFAADLRALCGEESPVLGLVVPWYGRALPVLRREIATSALTEHGKLATGVDWRLDTIAGSQAGGAIGAPVVMMTFRYQEGEKTDRVTLQLLPEMVQGLREACDKILGKRGP